MLKPDVLALLRCPEDRSPLSAASGAVVDEINAAIRAGRVANRAGKPVEQPIGGGLIRADGAVLYPIVDQIPVLLSDDAIPLAQLAERPRE